MANLKEIRSRISSVSSTMQITSAMKMVSAAKLKRAQDSISQFRIYAEKLQKLLQDVSGSIEEGGILTKQREVKNVLLIAINSNRGLCGGYNSSVIKKVNSILQDELKENNVQILTIGKKAHDILSKSQKIYKNASHIWNDIKFSEIAEIAEDLIKRFEDKEFDQIRIVYNQFKNAAMQTVKDEQFLPIKLNSLDQYSKNESDYIFNPSKEEILKAMIPQALKTQIYKAILDANASENGARMTAMHKATDNADSLRKSLIIQYNKARQASITNEILEIVGGSEALNG